MLRQEKKKKAQRQVASRRDGLEHAQLGDQKKSQPSYRPAALEQARAEAAGESRRHIVSIAEDK